ncbi:esterase [Selenomonas sp. FC4001]|uniref:esterase n=1 Tax=Selenomonas sp. FC4001 TaxID=1408313 RepID=UPI00068C51F9|nr:esterase [Selenomonas sp. FC4001]
MVTYEYGNPNAVITLVQTVDEHDIAGMDDEVAEIQRLSGKEFRLLAVKVESWNRDLSPWPAPAVFGKDDFGDCAGELLTEILKLCQDESKIYYLGGYSLAALFSLWAAYQTDKFAGIAAASPSIWFPRFVDYMKSTAIKCPNVYLSLGDKEEKTKNAVMASVGDCIRDGYAWLKEQRINCTLEWNTGGHFREPEIRTARAFAWLLSSVAVVHCSPERL